MHGAHAAEARGADGAAMVGVAPADDDALVRFAGEIPVAPHQPDVGVVRLTAGVGEKHVVQVRRGDLAQQVGEFDGRRMRRLEEIVVVRQVAQLLEGGVRQFLATVAHVDAPESGHAVQQLLAFGVVDVDTVSVGDDAAADIRQVAGVGKRMQVMFAIPGLPQ